MRRIALFILFLALLAVFLGNRFLIPAAAQDATTTPLILFAVSTVTPYPDGSIIHEVQPGESLSAISQAYGISFDELLTINTLHKDTMLYPGMKITIRAAFTPTPTDPSTPTITPHTPQPTSTRRPTRTPTVVVYTQVPIIPSATPPPTQSPMPALGEDQVANLLLLGIALLVTAGIVLVILGSLLKRKS